MSSTSRINCCLQSSEYLIYISFVGVYILGEEDTIISSQQATLPFISCKQDADDSFGRCQGVAQPKRHAVEPIGSRMTHVCGLVLIFRSDWQLPVLTGAILRDEEINFSQNAN